MGSGVSSEVFEARGPLGEIRAVKVLRAEYPRSGEVAWRLVQEGRALAALDHPHLIKVFETGTTAHGRPYFAMPKLEGETLRERLDRVGTLAPAEACALLGGVLDGLEAAHSAGIVHRDVKPANVFLARSGSPDFMRERAVLLDFGIAKVTGSSFNPSTGRHVIGTPRYLTPEQILGGVVDRRTDVYAMGLVLFEAMAGRGPYDAEGTVELMRAHLEERPRQLREFAAVPAEIDQVVARALQKTPAHRWPSADALVRALRAALDRGPDGQNASSPRRGSR